MDDSERWEKDKCDNDSVHEVEVLMSAGNTNYRSFLLELSSLGMLLLASMLRMKPIDNVETLGDHL